MTCEMKKTLFQTAPEQMLRHGGAREAADLLCFYVATPPTKNTSWKMQKYQDQNFRQPQLTFLQH